MFALITDNLSVFPPQGEGRGDSRLADREYLRTIFSLYILSSQFITFDFVSMWHCGTVTLSHCHTVETQCFRSQDRLGRQLIVLCLHFTVIYCSCGCGIVLPSVSVSVSQVANKDVELHLIMRSGAAICKYSPLTAVLQSCRAAGPHCGQQSHPSLPPSLPHR